MLAIDFLPLACVYFLIAEVSAQGEHEVRKNQFPYMAIVYYMDNSIEESPGQRFFRAAVLIKPDWLVSASIERAMIEVGFPKKTLLARVGAIKIDSQITLNEDEDEQETEVIEVVHPSHHRATLWWHTDISLLRVLLPFNLTKAVALAPLHSKQASTDKPCTILFFAGRSLNSSGEKTLMQMVVDLLPPNKENCGEKFHEGTMACAVVSEENKPDVYPTGYCQGNSGGPLICDGTVMGIQSYIDDSCKQPHLYQLLSKWDQLIVCATEHQCQNDCGNVCMAINKDAQNITATTSLEPEVRKLEYVNEIVPTMTTTDTTTLSTSFSTTEKSSTIEVVTTTSTDVITTSETPVYIEEIITTTRGMPSSVMPSQTATTPVSPSTFIPQPKKTTMKKQHTMQYDTTITQPESHIMLVSYDNSKRNMDIDVKRVPVIEAKTDDKKNETDISKPKAIAKQARSSAFTTVFPGSLLMGLALLISV